MRILDRSVYVGPSLHARFPVIRLELDLGESSQQWPTGRLGRVSSTALAAGPSGPGRTRLFVWSARGLFPAYA